MCYDVKSSTDEKKEKPGDLKGEDIVEELWRDFYESKCKLACSRRSLSLEEVLFARRE